MINCQPTTLLLTLITSRNDIVKGDSAVATDLNQKIVLASRPVGKPIPENFRLESEKKPTPKEGELLLRTIYLSLDPYMRGRLSDKASYAAPVEIDETIVGGTVCQVETSNHPSYQAGEWVLAYTGWTTYALSTGEQLIKLGTSPDHPSYALGILGMPGFTAYMGLLDIGQPKENETIVVAAATGAVGSVVGQIGKIIGAKVVGIAGGKTKCTHAKEILGFDDCIDHYEENFAQHLKESCSDGVDVYFENVGGKVFDAVLPLLNTGARIPLCGLISQYNATGLPQGPDRLSLLMSQILIKRLKVQGFIIFDDYAHRYNEFVQQMTDWITKDQIKYQEQIIDDLENTPEAFIGLLEGKNFGKLIIKVSNPI